MIPGAMPATTPHSTAPWRWCSHVDEIDVNRIVAVAVATARWTTCSGGEPLVAEDEGEQRHHRHAAADAEQPREKADERAERDEGDDQRRIHALMACAWRAW